MTIDLPFTAASPFLDWLPDETLFSLCSRHHQLWGYSTSSQSAEMMFGGKRTGTHHDLPNALDVFQLRTRAHHGRADQLARERTLLRYYRPFVPGPEVDAAVMAMRGPSVVHLKFRLGLLTSRFRANHPLKACRACMRADVENHGWAYWHLPHQYPGIWTCPAHRDPLLVSTVKSTGVERFFWKLPINAELSDAWLAGLDEVAGEALSGLTQLTSRLVEMDDEDGWINPSVVQPAFRARMALKGWITSGGNVRATAAAASYLDHCAKLRIAPELVALSANEDEAKLQVGRLVRPFRTGTHPLRLLVAIHWLFGSAAAFQDAISQGRPFAGCDRGGVDSQLADAPATVEMEGGRKRVVELLHAGMSASAAARSTGVDVGTVMAWAAAADIHIGRRAKLLKGEVKVSLVGALCKGADKREAAASHGVSVETVTKVLRKEIGLHSAWAAARAANMKGCAREAWLAIFEVHQGSRNQDHAGDESGGLFMAVPKRQSLATEPHPARASCLLNSPNERSPLGRAGSPTERGCRACCVEPVTVTTRKAVAPLANLSGCSESEAKAVRDLQVANHPEGARCGPWQAQRLKQWCRPAWYLSGPESRHTPTRARGRP